VWNRLLFFPPSASFFSPPSPSPLSARRKKDVEGKTPPPRPPLPPPFPLFPPPFLHLLAEETLLAGQRSYPPPPSFGSLFHREKKWVWGPTTPPFLNEKRRLLRRPSPLPSFPSSFSLALPSPRATAKQTTRESCFKATGNFFFPPLRNFPSPLPAEPELC